MPDAEKLALPEAEQRQLIVDECRSWIATPYHHAADVKGSGVDCGMLLIKVFANVGLIDFIDPRPYPRDWHMHKDGERYLGIVEGLCGPEVPNAEVADRGLLPGDVLVWRFGRTFSHGGIVTAWPHFVHAFWPSRIVEEPDWNGTMFSEPWRYMKVYDFWRHRK
jgi:cell wall-associated NlpC family hydrolase